MNGGITLFPENVDTVRGQELKHNEWVDFTSPADGVVTFTVEVVVLHFAVSDEGDVNGEVTNVEVQWRYADQAAWTTEWPTAVAMSATKGRYTTTITNRSGNKGRTPRRISIVIGQASYANQAFAFSGDKAIDIRVRRLTPDPTDSRSSLQSQIASVRWIQEDVSDFSGRNPLAMRVRATGQLYGAIDAFNARVRQRVPTWNATTETWGVAAASSNPAALYRKVLRGFYAGGTLIAGVGAAAGEIEDDELGEWYEFCETNGLTCNLVIRATLDDATLLTLIAQCGWASPTDVTGKYSVVWEEENKPLSGVFSPANIVAGSVQVTHSNEDLADEIIGEFVDAESDYSPNDVRRAVQGVVSPVNAVTIPLRGITNGTQAKKEANRTAAAQFHHQRVIRWRTTAEGLVCTRGDRVALSHGLVGGATGGRLVAVSTAARANLWAFVPSTALSISAALDNRIDVWVPNGEVRTGTFHHVDTDATLSQAQKDAIEAEVGTASYYLTAINLDGDEGYDATSYKFMAYSADSPMHRVEITGAEQESDGGFTYIARDFSSAYYAARTDDLTHEFVRVHGLTPTILDVVANTSLRDGRTALVNLHVTAENWRRGYVQVAVVENGEAGDSVVLAVIERDLTAQFVSPVADGRLRITVIPGSEQFASGNPYSIDYTLDVVARVEGADGEDGVGIEYVFAATVDPTVPANQRPSNTWGYDSGGTANGLTWTDGAPSLTAALPYLWRARRKVEGAPDDAAEVSGAWTAPVIVGRFGPDGEDGDDGLGVDGSDGSDGAPGDDGLGIEYVFAIAASASIPSRQRPLNSWGYDSGGTVNGQAWTDGAPNLTAALPYLWRSRRKVPGGTAVGAAVSDSWTSPTIVGRFGVEGTDGDDGIDGSNGSDGVPGDDGLGIEYVFARTASASVSSSRRPLNSWGYDSPAARGGLTWSDGAPNLSDATPYLWRSQRKVPGGTSDGASVSDTWTAPVIVGRFGPAGEDGTDGVEGGDGTDGVAGDDGLGIEYVFASTAAATVPSNQRPSNGWGYDSPATVNRLTWTDGAPSLTAALPYLWRSRRKVPGGTADGAAVSDRWTTPVIVGRFGPDGEDGTDGVEGADGSDGAGIEYVFTRSLGGGLHVTRRPSNTWGYDSGGTTANGQVWTDAAPSLTAALPNLWRSQRKIEGVPVDGAAVSGAWTVPKIVGRFGATGEDGEDGGDGAGIEYIFAATNLASVPANQRPLNSWGYDSPVARGGLTWTDGAPSLSNALPYLWLSQRKIIGAPVVGDAVSATWTEPKIVGRFGTTGDDGDDGISAVDVQNAQAVFVSTDGTGSWSSASQVLSVTFRRDGVSLGSATVTATVTAGSRSIGEGTKSSDTGVTLVSVQNTSGIRVWVATHTASGSKATLAATLEISGYRDRGQWVAGRNYTADDVVQFTVSINLGLGAYNPGLGVVTVALRFRATSTHLSSNANSPSGVLGRAGFWTLFF